MLFQHGDKDNNLYYAFTFPQMKCYNCNITTFNLKLLFKSTHLRKVRRGGRSERREPIASETKVAGRDSLNGKKRNEIRISSL